MSNREKPICKTYEEGSRRWYLNDKFHREDGPALEYINGTKAWYLNGKLHREGGPAIEYVNGGKDWYLSGVRYSKEEFDKLMAEKQKPVCKTKEYDTKHWYLNGKFHREDGPALGHTNGSEEWYLNGKLHREDGPAVKHDNGAKEWRRWGKRHREDGPAIEFADGSKQWWLNGTKYSEEEFNKLMAEKQQLKKENKMDSESTKEEFYIIMTENKDGDLIPAGGPVRNDKKAFKYSSIGKAEKAAFERTKKSKRRHYVLEVVSFCDVKPYVNILKKRGAKE
jgi:hypothetical protein